MRALLLATTLLGLALEARAERPPVTAVVPFAGPHGRQAEAVVVRVLKKKAIFLPQALWLKAAKKLAATGSNSPENVAAVAEEVGARIVVTGTVKRDGRSWQLVVSVRDGRTGRSHDKLKYQLKVPRLTPATLDLLAKEVDEAFDHTLEAAATSPVEEPAPEKPKPAEKPEKPKPAEKPKIAKNEPPPPAAAPEPPAEPPPPARAEEAPPLETRSPPLATAKEAPRARPRWAPWFDVSAGGSVTGRSFDFDPISQPRFKSGVVGGLRIDATVYPLAFTWKRAAGQLAGLGLGVTLDKPIWPDSSPRNDPTQKFATDELRVEGGLRWRFILLKRVPRPEVTALIGGGMHSFSIAKLSDGSDVGPADVGYKYASIGAQLRLHFAEWASLHLGFLYHAVLDAGAIQTSNEYGGGSAWGIRMAGGLDFFVWRGIKVGAIGFYERFVIAFTGTGNPLPAKVASSALDQYFGGAIVAGYVF